MRYKPTETARRGEAGQMVWASAAGDLGRGLRRGWPLLGVLVVAGAVAGPALVALAPRSQQATAQLVIDPRGLQVFAAEPGGAVIDANAGINFVETQVQLLTSERVLARVARLQAAGRDVAAEDLSLRPSLGEVDPRAVASLRRALTIRRGERSFVVDVTAKASTSERAASIANDVVKAFMEEDAASRAEAGRRLTSEMAGRLSTLRDGLGKAEAKAEAFRTERGLLSSGGEKLVSEQRLEEAVTELGAAQARVARAAARVAQLETAKLDPGSLGPLTATEDIRTISYVIERLSVAREGLADMKSNLGPRHPALLGQETRVRELEQRLRTEVGRVREAERANLERARGELAATEANVKTLSAAVATDRKATTELRALEDVVKADRDLLSTFETRSREVDEFSRVSPANVRIASLATPEEGSSRMILSIAAALVGATLGGLVGVSVIAFRAFVALGRAPSRPVSAGPASAAPRSDAPAAAARRIG